MIVIADSNIFYSALIVPNGEIATILKDRNMQFIAPDFIIEEVKEHLDVIKAGRRKDTLFHRRGLQESFQDILTVHPILPVPFALFFVFAHP